MTFRRCIVVAVALTAITCVVIRDALQEISDAIEAAWDQGERQA